MTEPTEYTEAEGTFTPQSASSKNISEHTTRTDNSQQFETNSVLDSSSEPRNYKSLREIYDNTEEIELDEELYPMGVEEPTCYEQVAKETEWRQAIKKEIEAVEKN